MAPCEKQGGGVSFLGCVMAVGIIGFLLYLLLPDVRSRTSTRMECGNNLKAIALALYNYHGTYGVFPPAFTTSKVGEPLHSWRTLLLPYLEQTGLYEQIDLNQPWNSVHNRRFAEIELSCYTCPKTGHGLAYLGVATPGGLFDGTTPHSLADITDGMATTVAIIEVPPCPVSWMEPVDFDQQYFDDNLVNGLASNHPGGTQVACLDGSVRFVSNSVDDQLLSALLTIAGGEDVSGRDW